jgi:8-oxo-dGTP diphosphatase
MTRVFFMYKEIQPIVGIGAVVFHNDAVLLIKRKNPPYQNEWCIPGGKIQPGETLQQAAEREIQEETGVQIQAGAPIYAFDIIDRDNHNKPTLHYVVIDLLAEYISGNPVARDDAIEAAWVGRDTFKERVINETTRKLLTSKFQFP